MNILGIKTIFEDDSLLILDKPPGLVVDRSQTQKGNTLEDWLADRGNNLERHGIVHRLDKDTSGIILIAKTPQALDYLQGQFKGRQVKKQYLALVHGFVTDAGRVEGNIGRNPKNREKFMVVSPGISTSKESKPTFEVSVPSRWSVTEYEPIKRLMIKDLRLKNIFKEFNKIQMRKLEKMNYNQFTLLKCKPETGRTHQIRVHLKYIGHPIVSDEKYVGRRMYRLDKRWCPRQFLHAAKLKFKHPGSGQWMQFESKLPEDLKKAIEV